MTPLAPDQPPPRYELIGHRGAPRELPQNSLPSFMRAFERGAAAIELDVHATLDGVIIVHHDPILGRGVVPDALRGRAIAELDWNTLSQVQLTMGIGIPRLDVVFAAIPPEKMVYVEIKADGIEEQVATAIGPSGGRCAVHSFNHATIARMRELAPDVPRGILFDKYPHDVVPAMRAVEATDVWPEWKLVDKKLVDEVHEEGGRVIAWTVNSGAAAQRLVGLGVDGLCSDDLRLFRTLQ